MKYSVGFLERRFLVFVSANHQRYFHATFLKATVVHFSLSHSPPSLNCFKGPKTLERTIPFVYRTARKSVNRFHRFIDLPSSETLPTMTDAIFIDSVLELSQDSRKDVRQCWKSIRSKPKFMEPYLSLLMTYQESLDEVAMRSVLELANKQFPGDPLFRSFEISFKRLKFNSKHKKNRSPMEVSLTHYIVSRYLHYFPLQQLRPPFLGFSSYSFNRLYPIFSNHIFYPIFVIIRESP